MKFARLVERGARQILMTVGLATEIGEESGYIVVVETHYQGEQFVSMFVGQYPTHQIAYDNMMSMTDDEVVRIITNLIDAIEENEQ